MFSLINYRVRKYGVTEDPTEYIIKIFTYGNCVCGRYPKGMFLMFDDVFPEIGNKIPPFFGYSCTFKVLPLSFNEVRNT